MNFAVTFAAVFLAAAPTPTPAPAPVALPTLPAHTATATPAPAPAASTSAALSADQMGKIDQVAEQALSTQAVTGISLAVVRDGRVVYSRAYGYSSIELQQTARDTSVYEIGSITKQFTAGAILLLAEEGKLTLDDSLAKYVPDFPRAKEITLRQLLSMTSGIPDYTDQPAFDSSVQKPATPADVVALVKTQPLDFDPGTRFEYSNTNYFLLGMVIEKASGQSYADYLYQRVFRSLGMSATQFGNAGASSPDLATGYSFDGRRIKPDVPWNLDWAYSAGGIVSSVLDLAVWDTALLQGKPISLGSLRTMWSPISLKDGTKVPYGFGWSIETLYGHREIDTNGGLPGYNGRNAAFPNDQFDVVVLGNSQAFAAGPVVRQIFELFYPPTKAQMDAQQEGDAAAAARARDIFRRLQTGTLDASQLTTSAAKRLTGKLLAQAKSSLSRLGSPTKVEQYDKYLLGTQTSYAYRLTFKQGLLGFSLTLDNEGKVGALSVQPL